MRALAATLGSMLLLLVLTAVHAQPSWPGDVPAEPALQARQLGVLVEEIPLSRLDALQLPYGVRVSHVFPGSAAQAGGLQPDDVILEVDGHPVFSVSRLRWLVQKSNPRDSLNVKYYRAGQQANAELRLASPQPAAPPAPESRDERVWRSPGYLGVGLQPLTPGLRQAFSVPAGVGVLIAEVYAGTPASKSGLAAGDVIVRMDRRTIRDIADVHRVLDYFEPGEQLAIEVTRDGKNDELTVTLGERDKVPGPEPGRDWGEQRGDRQPLFDPAWWDDIQDFMDRWKDYFEQKRSAPPPVAL